jgi:uncharacterized protein (TIGR03435 family)
MTVLTALPAASAQTPKFEVVSIRPCRPDSPRSRSGNRPPGGPTDLLYINCITVEQLIQNAYDVLATGTTRFRAEPVPIEDAPAWVRSERFTIEAKAESVQPRAMMQGPMMRMVLEDRFKLKLRRVPREIPVYFMTLVKGGPRNFVPAKPGSCMAWDLDHMPTPTASDPDPFPCGMISRRVQNGTAEVDLRGASMPNVTEGFAVLLGRDVIDKTGLSGVFDIHVEFAAEELTAEPAPRDAGPPAGRIDESALGFAAARKLGLKFESGKGPGEIFVIDHIERPSEN